VFSGVIEATGKIAHLKKNPGTVLISVTRPQSFNDLKLGDSVCVNGVCLTVEKFDESLMEFSLGVETLKITGWDESNLLGKDVNLERSLVFGARVHGHLVTGHVEDLITVTGVEDMGGSRVITFALPAERFRFVVPKGSVAINGVSLTVNDVEENSFSVCLIPETLKRTNLGALAVSDKVCLETDYMIRAVGKLWQ
jgi:riboflavin synthase